MATQDERAVIRPLASPGELGLFRRFPHRFNDELAGDLDDGHRRLDWLWVALDGGRPLGRLAWWRRPGQAGPQLLDLFDLAGGGDREARLNLGERLYREASAHVLTDGGEIPQYIRFTTVHWRDDPVERLTVEDAMTILERTGARLLVERVNLEWRPGAPAAPPSGRLRFRPVAGPRDLVDLMTAVLDGTLDAHDRRSLTRMTAAQVATEHYEDELARYDSPRDWWRVATLPDGDPAGFVIPAHNGYNPIIAYIGVLPRHRGHGYIDDLLAEGTRVLLAAGDLPRIRATTDLGNVPMARAFHRAGWTATGHEINMTWEPVT